MLRVSEINLHPPSARLSAVIQHLDCKMKCAPKSLRSATFLHRRRDWKHYVYAYTLHSTKLLPMTDKEQEEKRKPVATYGKLQFSHTTLEIMRFYNKKSLKSDVVPHVKT